MSRNLNEAASKDTLAQWMSLLQYKALTGSNIKKRFFATGIWPLNDHAMDSMLAPSESFERQQGGFNMGHAQQQSHASGQLHVKGHGNMPGNDCAEEDHEARTSDQVQLVPEQHYDDAAMRGDHNDEDDDHNYMNWNDDEDVGEQSEGGHGDEGPQDGDGYLVDAVDMAVEFST
jgi:hypothetical protein